MQLSLTASGNPRQGNCPARSIMAFLALLRKGRAGRVLSRSPHVLQQLQSWGRDDRVIGVTMQEAVPWGMMENWFSKGFIICPTHGAQVSEWGTCTHVSRVVWVWGPGDAAKAMRGCTNPYISRGLDASLSIKSAHTHPPWEGACLGQFGPTCLTWGRGCQAAQAVCCARASPNPGGNQLRTFHHLAC